jgi:hypothetical protein
MMAASLSKNNYMKNRNLPLSKVILGVGAFLFSGCANPDASTSSVTTVAEKTVTANALVFDKLLGIWQSGDGKSFERWTKHADGTYASVVYMLNGKDTAFQERAKIYEDHGKWIFENTVSGQNEGKSVKFTSGTLTEKAVQFSNPAHDFPNEINYTLPDDNTVNAFIVGKNAAGGNDTIPFNYKRIK